MNTKLVSFLRSVLFNDKLALLHELLFILFFHSGALEEFWSILIIKQHFAESVFVLAPWLIYVCHG